MRPAVFILCALFICCALAMPVSAAEEMWVKDTIRVSVRVNPTDKAAQKGLIVTGDKVTVTRNDGNWSYIKSVNSDLEGWVLTSMLIDKAPAIYVNTRLENEYSQLKETYDKDLAELETLRTENANLKQVLDESNEQTQAYRILMENTGNDLTGLLTLREDYVDLQAEMATKTARLEALENSASKAVFYNYLRWFISGAAVLFVGFIIGLIARRGGGNNRRYY